MCTLNQIKIGQYGVVLSITEDPYKRNKILSLGIVPGIVIKVLDTNENGYLCLIRNREVLIDNQYLGDIFFQGAEQ